MSQTKAELIKGLNINASAPATALQIDASGNVNIDSNTLYVDATNNRVGLGTSSPGELLTLSSSGTTGTAIRIENTSTGGYNWGIYSIGSAASLAPVGSLAFRDSTNGATRLVIDSSGRVGIGTTAPGYLLDVSGSSDEIVIGARSSTTGAAISFRDSTTTSTARPQVGAIGNDLVIKTGNTPAERARIDSSGRLLVGTSSTSNICTAVFRGNSTDSAGNGLVRLERNTTSPAADDTLGNLSFGTTGTTSTNAAAWILGSRDGGTWTNGSSHPGRLVFSTTRDAASSPTEAARINNLGAFKATTTGSVVTATTSSHEFTNANTGEEYAFRIRHGAATSNIYGMLIEFTGQTPNNTTSHFGVYADTTNIKFGFRSDGGLANYSGNNVNLCDQREKKNIENLDSTWDCLKHWELKKFHYNEDSETDDLRYGVIAQQIAEHCPEVISEWVKQQAQLAQVDDDGNEIEPAKEEIVRLGVKEQQMMWMAIKALQEAQTRIETLEAEVAALKGQ